jgi:16S rRNA (uracil1498-N3)-methyltransferase
VQRYFAKEKVDNQFNLLNDDLYHIKTVMRMKSGDKVEVVYENNVYLCEVQFLKDEVSIIELEQLQTTSNLEPKITLILPFLKEQKMDLILQKGTELGIDEFIFIETERTIVKIEDKKEQSKLERWSRICKEASEQSMRLDIPNVKIERNKDNLENLVGLKLLCSTQEKDKTVKNLLKNTRNYDKINIMIGPEGGFSVKEEIYFEKKGFTKVSLGSQIMRVETVPVFLASIIRYEFME